MACSLIPRYRCGSIYDLRPEELRRRGITLLMADLDNTLARYRQPLPTTQLTAWKEALEAAGIQLFLVSNCRKPHRVTRFCQALGIDFVGHSGKPGLRGFHAAMEQTGRDPTQSAMVGDQVFTDMWGGNRANVLTILVEPLALDSLFRKLRYGVETPFRRAAVPWEDRL